MANSGFKRSVKFQLLAIAVISLAFSFSVESLGQTKTGDSKNLKTKFVIAPTLETPGRFSEGLTVSGHDYINREGKVVLTSSDWQALGNFIDGRAAVREVSFITVGLAGFIDKSGKMRVEPKYVNYKNFSEGLAAVKSKVIKDKKSDSLWGFVDSNGKVVIKPQFRNVLSGFSEGIAIVVNDDKIISFIDKSGRVLATSKENVKFCTPFQNGLAMFGIGSDDSDDRKWGYLNKKWKLVIPAKYETANAFRNGLARIVVNGKSGFIDQSGKTVVQPVWNYAYPFENGRAMVQNAEKKWGIIDRNGRIVQKPIWNSVGALHDLRSGEPRAIYDGIVSVYDGENWRHITANGTVLPGKWEATSVSSEGLICVMTNGKWGYIANPVYRQHLANSKSNSKTR